MNFSLFISKFLIWSTIIFHVIKYVSKFHVGNKENVQVDYKGTIAVFNVILLQMPSTGTNNETSIENEFYSASVSEDGHASHLPPEIWKTVLSLGYLFIVTWITAFVMVIVHDRVPDMKKYPPLPDIFLDNVPHIPWAFDMCEVTGTLLFAIWLVVLIFHKYR